MLSLHRANKELQWAKPKVDSLGKHKSKEFIQNNFYSDQSHVERPEKSHRSSAFEYVNGLRSVSTFRLNMAIPHTKILKEAKALKNDFVPHREDPNFGWKALTIHGTQPTHTNDYYVYGFKNREEANYKWTSVADKCPVTTAWLKKSFPYDIYHRIRFVMLEPGGFITPHRDTDGERGFFAVNVALNQPFGCMMFMDQFGLVHWKPGDIRLMDIGLRHSVYNFSHERRYHMIIHGYCESKESRQRMEKILTKSLFPFWHLRRLNF